MPRLATNFWVHDIYCREGVVYRQCSSSECQNSALGKGFVSGSISSSSVWLALALGSRCGHLLSGRPWARFPSLGMFLDQKCKATRASKHRDFWRGVGCPFSMGLGYSGCSEPAPTRAVNLWLNLSRVQACHIHIPDRFRNPVIDDERAKILKGLWLLHNRRRVYSDRVRD